MTFQSCEGELTNECDRNIYAPVSGTRDQWFLQATLTSPKGGSRFGSDVALLQQGRILIVGLSESSTHSRLGGEAIVFVADGDPTEPSTQWSRLHSYDCCAELLALRVLID